MHTRIEPQITVIIPCYNHGKFLRKAIESIRSQNVPSIEIIVVDDGSADNTAEISKDLEVNYIWQKNMGLSSARNTGIKHSKGDFLVFLDADDWLLPGALKKNADILNENPDLAFVSGAHEKVHERNDITHDVYAEVETDHYLHLLAGNYIGMHATVMYQEWIFNEFLFDTSLSMCEDYDLFLKIARKYPVAHHTQKIAAYRFHDDNMSNDTPKMLEAALNVLSRHASHLSTKAEKRAFKKGREFWINYYTRQLGKEIQSNRKSLSFYNLFPIIRYKPSLAIKLFSTKIKSAISIGK